jgi:hypothetical protein
VAGASSPARRWRISSITRVTAARAMSAMGWWMVLSSGHTVVATGVSSKPHTLNASGTCRPMPCATARVAAAMSSLLAKMALGRVAAASSWRAASSPER